MTVDGKKGTKPQPVTPIGAERNVVMKVDRYGWRQREGGWERGMGTGRDGRIGIGREEDVFFSSSR